ncbi:MAG: cysteine--tRNA ligase [Candidatus Bilamarchaeaceae archaeon]
MKIYNSLTKKYEEFRPLEDKKIVLYTCGLTPYDQAHIGHARTYVAFDIIKRYLIHKGYRVFHIQNITDVDDKIINRCKEIGLEPKELTEKNHAEAIAMFDALNILRADVYPKVTENIKTIIDFIKKIIEKGYAYETETGVYFDISKFNDYGKLSGQNLQQIIAGARKEVDETKEDAADFALWKKTKGEIIEFDSPWGRGRPGWHIECSAIAIKYANRETIDIHGGARDLIFPHHENEIAQSEAATGKPFSKYWLHTGFLTVNGEKMSKSLGNFITIKDALEKFHPMAFRIFYIKSHYRSPVDYSEESVKEAKEIYERICNVLRFIEDALVNKKECDETINFENAVKKFYDAMDNDFDTPQALAALFEFMHIINLELTKDAVNKEILRKAKEELQKMIWILGISCEKKKINESALMKIAEKFGVKEENAEKALQALIQIREKARKEKNYSLSDSIRASLKEAGIILEDKKEGAGWRVE